MLQPPCMFHSTPIHSIPFCARRQFPTCAAAHDKANHPVAVPIDCKRLVSDCKLVHPNFMLFESVATVIKSVDCRAVLCGTEVTFRPQEYFFLSDLCSRPWGLTDRCTIPSPLVAMDPCSIGFHSLPTQRPSCMLGFPQPFCIVRGPLNHLYLVRLLIGWELPGILPTFSGIHQPVRGL